MDLVMKRGDTLPRFRAQCRAVVYDSNGAQVGTPGPDGKTPVDLSGATAKLLIKDHPSKTLTIESNGWVSYAWLASDLGQIGSFRLEVEVRWPDGNVQTFAGDHLLIVRRDLG